MAGHNRHACRLFPKRHSPDAATTRSTRPAAGFLREVLFRPACGRCCLHPGGLGAAGWAALLSDISSGHGAALASEPGSLCPQQPGDVAAPGALARSRQSRRRGLGAMPGRRCGGDRAVGPPDVGAHLRAGDVGLGVGLVAFFRLGASFASHPLKPPKTLPT